MKQVNRFEMVPTGNVPRTKMTILSGHKTSINAGKLTPVYADIDVLPHQTKKLSVDFVLRGTTFKTPIMDYFFIDFFAFSSSLFLISLFIFSVPSIASFCNFDAFSIVDCLSSTPICIAS